MELKEFSPGDVVSLSTKDRSWNGVILESFDPDVVLLKLDSGYNIGIREREVLNARLVKKSSSVVKKQEVLSRNGNLRNVALVVTGGTISSRLDPKTGAVAPSSVSDLLGMSPGLSSVCNIVRVERPFSLLSEDISFVEWKKLAKVVHGLLLDAEVDGVIVSHGTDTLSFTASALSFFLRGLNKPVAVTYAQKSIDRPSTDASLNLLCAAKFAVSDIAEVALVGHASSSDDWCLALPAVRSRKLHSSSRDAFQVVNGVPLARISSDDFVVESSFRARNDGVPFLDAKCSSDVALVRVFPGASPLILDFFVKKKYKGLVLEVSGLGHVPKSWVPKLRSLVASGITVCATPQTIFGRLNPFVYSSGRKLLDAGVLFLDDMLSETAFVKLSWVLAHKGWQDNIEEKMKESVCGEISIS